MDKRAPAWAPNAIPSAAGWKDPKTGEVLKCQKGLLTEADPVVVEEAAKEPAPEPQVLTEEPAAPAPEAAPEPAEEPAKPKPARKKRASKKATAKAE